MKKIFPPETAVSVAFEWNPKRSSGLNQSEKCMTQGFSSKSILKHEGSQRKSRSASRSRVHFKDLPEVCEIEPVDEDPFIGLMGDFEDPFTQLIDEIIAPSKFSISIERNDKWIKSSDIAVSDSHVDAEITGSPSKRSEIMPTDDDSGIFIIPEGVDNEEGQTMKNNNNNAEREEGELPDSPIKVVPVEGLSLSKTVCSQRAEANAKRMKELTEAINQQEVENQMLLIDIGNAVNKEQVSFFCDLNFSCFCFLSQRFSRQFFYSQFIRFLRRATCTWRL